MEKESEELTLEKSNQIQNVNAETKRKLTILQEKYSK